MIKIDLHNKYIFNDYEFINYVDLSDSEKFIILEKRNNPTISNKMINHSIISRDEHFKFIENLCYREDSYYWLVYNNKKIIGTYNIQKIDKSHLTCEPGIFYFNTKPDGIDEFNIIFKFTQNSLDFTFNQLGFEKLYAHIHINNKFIIKIDKYFGYVDTNELFNNEFKTFEISKEDFNRKKQIGFDIFNLFKR